MKNRVEQNPSMSTFRYFFLHKANSSWVWKASKKDVCICVGFEEGQSVANSREVLRALFRTCLYSAWPAATRAHWRGYSFAPWLNQVVLKFTKDWNYNNNNCLTINTVWPVDHTLMPPRKWFVPVKKGLYVCSENYAFRLLVLLSTPDPKSSEIK